MLQNGMRLMVVIGFLCCASGVAAQDPPQRPGGMRGDDWRGGMGRPGFGMWGLMGPTDPAEILQKHPKADTDGDGKLSQAEHRAFMTAHRATLEKEFLAAHPELDSNTNGKLDPDEMRAGAAVVEEFARAKVLAANPEADTDGDGKLSREEFRAFQSRRGGPPVPPTAHVDWLIENFQTIDADGDGQITVAELQQFKRGLDRQQRGRRDGAGPRGEGREPGSGDQPRERRGGRGQREGGRQRNNDPAA